MARNKLLTACALAVLTTALYGCSSSDDGGRVGAAEAERDAALAAQAAAESALAAAQAALAAAETRRDEAIAAEATAQAAQAAAEAAQAAAEAAEMAADAARMMAEGDRDTAMAAQMAAEAAQAAAEMRATEAEAAQMAAEQAQMDAEALVAGAEAAQMAAEAAQATAEAAQMTAETAQAAAEAAAAQAVDRAAAAAAAQALAEADRDDAQAAQMAAEAAQAAAEVAQMTAEAAAEAAMAAQMTAESERDAAQAAQMAADTARMEAETALAMATGDAADAVAAQMAAEAAQATAEAARMAAETAQAAAEAAAAAAVTRAAEAATAQAMAEAERDAAVTARMAAETAKTEAETAKAEAERRLAEVEAERDKYKAMVESGESDDASVAAKALFDALSNYRTDANALNTADGGGAIETTFTVAAKRGEAPELTATAPTGTDFDETDTAVGSLHGWMGTELESKDGTTTDTVHIYTNVEAPTTVTFEKFVTSTAAVTFVAGTSNTVAVSAAGTDHDAYVKAPSVFASGAGTKRHADNVDIDGTPGVDAFRTSGTFAGASGVYTCETTDTCGSRVTEDGIELGTIATDGTFTVGSWTFVPSGGAMAQLPDSQYQYFGWWLRNMDGAYTVNAFAAATGDVALEGAPFALLQGEATYEGPVAGKYSLNSLLGEGSEREAGHFTATAELEVDFGSDTGFGTIEGMVDRFMGRWESKDWEVELQSQDLNTTGGIDTPGTDNVVWSIGDDDSAAAGTWSAQLREVGGDGVPKAATGTFDAAYGDDGYMIGAFGAVRQ